jgi:hypothetical protein
MIGEGAATDPYIRPAGDAEAGISIKRDSVVFGQLSYEQDRFNRATADHISSQFIRYPAPERNFRPFDQLA